MYKIYLVEDDEAISSILCENLKQWGYEIEACRDFSRVCDQFDTFAPDIVILDISLPFYNGFYWCGKIREKSTVPVVFLSSHSENMDMVMAMNMGGDDYLTKPFDMNVLVAKLNALIRRVYEYGEKPSPDILSAGGATLDCGKCEVSGKNGSVELTKNELRILKTLFERKNSVVAREEIISELWQDASFVDDNTLTVNINRLRGKLSEIGLCELIVTRKGIGYGVNDN